MNTIYVLGWLLVDWYALLVLVVFGLLVGFTAAQGLIWYGRFNIPALIFFMIDVIVVLMLWQMTNQLGACCLINGFAIWLGMLIVDYFIQPVSVHGD